MQLPHWLFGGSLDLLLNIVSHKTCTAMSEEDLLSKTKGFYERIMVACFVSLGIKEAITKPMSQIQVAVRCLTVHGCVSMFDRKLDRCLALYGIGDIPAIRRAEDSEIKL